MTGVPPADVSAVGSTVHVGVRAIGFDHPRGGLERAAGEHVRMLRERGRAVCVHSTAAQERLGGVTFREVRWPLPAAGPGRPAFGVAYRIWGTLLARSLDGCWSRGDIAHLHGAASFALSRVHNKDIRRRGIVNPHGMEEFEKGSYWQETNRYFVRRMGRQGAQYAAKIISTDQGMSRTTIQNLSVSADKLVVIPNTIDLSRADGFEPNIIGSPNQESFPDIVTVGRMVRNKGYDNLARALLALETRGQITRRLRWTHYGSGPQQHIVEGILHTSRLLRLDVVHGADDGTIARSLRSSRIFVQPSRYEGSSLTTLEAMAQGATIVATPVGGIPDKIADEVTGILAVDATWQALADAVARGLNYVGGNLGLSARQIVEKRFTHEIASAQYTELYDQLDWTLR